MRLSHRWSQPSTQVLALQFAAMLHQLRRDTRQALVCAELALGIAAEQGFSFWHAGGTVLRGWALASGGSAREGIALLQDGLKAWADTGSTAAAKPLPSVVRTKSRRVKSRPGVRLSRSLRNMRCAPGRIHRGKAF